MLNKTNPYLSSSYSVNNDLFNDLVYKAFPKSFVGFDRHHDILSRAADIIGSQGSDKYPPYNIIRVNDTEYRIELAVAGVSINDLSIEVEDGYLTISRAVEDKTDADYIFRGIAQRSFTRKFVLDEHARVESAFLENGILNVNLRLEVPEHLKPRKIEITQGALPYQPELLVE